MSRRAALATVLVLGGCATAMTPGDRHFLAGDLEQAEIAYRGYLTAGRAHGDSEARARYRLGLIYAMPDSDLHDWEKADRALTSLIEDQPSSPWAKQAEFLLSLHRERSRLERELARQKDRASVLLHEVAQLQHEAKQVDDQVEDREALMARLSAEIGRLRSEIGELGTQLEAREQELERIKKIDLQTPP